MEDLKLDRRSWDLGFIAGKEEGIKEVRVMLLSLYDALGRSISKEEEPKDA